MNLYWHDFHLAQQRYSDLLKGYSRQERRSNNLVPLTTQYINLCTNYKAHVRRLSLEATAETHS